MFIPGMNSTFYIWQECKKKKKLPALQYMWVTGTQYVIVQCVHIMACKYAQAGHFIAGYERHVL